jgi:hypothetical protein
MTLVASSSAPDRLHLALDVTGLAPLFGEHVFSATQVTHGKPAPDLFLLAARTMNAAPAQCIVIEDSPAEPGVVVWVGGAVATPGVYEFESGARVNDAVRLPSDNTKIRSHTVSNSGNSLDVMMTPIPSRTRPSISRKIHTSVATLMTSGTLTKNPVMKLRRTMLNITVGSRQSSVGSRQSAISSRQSPGGSTCR